MLYADDVVNLYFQGVKHIEQAQGQVFNIGGGIENSLSLLELFALLEELLGIKMQYKELPFRESDQLVFVADNTKAQKILQWQPKMTSKRGIEKMVEWIENK